MATFAVISKLPIVHVITRVTTDTGAVRRAVFFPGNMAVRAGHTEVRPLQRKVAEVVIENTTVNRHDVGTSPFVIGMANDALALLGRIEQSMKARSLDPVVTNVFMAVNAERRLRQIGLTVMTGSTLAFYLGMSLDYPSGHDQFLEAGNLGLYIGAE